MKKYKTIFFDLDHTLWDFDRNSFETIAELFNTHELENAGVRSLEEFMVVYREVNHVMWDEYHRNKINKATLRAGRFSRALNSFGVYDHELTEKLASQYLELCPHKTHLFPHTLEVLEYLGNKYRLHIITNGFKEVQYTKIKKSGIGKYFDSIHISEEIGFKKPETEIFNYAIKQSGTIHDDCIMIGDNIETDILGAMKAGIDHIWFNPLDIKSQHKADLEIKNLIELKVLL